MQAGRQSVLPMRTGGPQIQLYTHSLPRHHNAPVCACANKEWDMDLAVHALGQLTLRRALAEGRACQLGQETQHETESNAGHF